MSATAHRAQAINRRCSCIGCKTPIRTPTAGRPAESNPHALPLRLDELHQLARLIGRQHGWPGNPAINLYLRIRYMRMLLKSLHQLLDAKDFLPIIIPYIHSCFCFTRHSIDGRTALDQAHIHSSFFGEVSRSLQSNDPICQFFNGIASALVVNTCVRTASGNLQVVTCNPLSLINQISIGTSTFQNQGTCTFPCQGLIDRLGIAGTDASWSEFRKTQMCLP